MLTGASVEVNVVNTIIAMACCHSRVIAVPKGIATELIGHHFPLVIFHLPDHDASLIYGVPHLHLVRSLKDQQVLTVEGINLCHRLHLRLHTVIKRTVRWSLP